MKRSPPLAVLILLIVAATTQAQENPKSPPPVNPDRAAATHNPHGQLGATGKVFIGDQAPDFELDGSRGAPVKLSRLRGDWLLLVFADRRDQVVPLRSIQDDLRDLGVRIVAVCHEKARTLDNYAARDSVPLMLADVTGEVCAEFGLWNSARRETVPGFMVLDRDGIVRIAFSGHLLPPDEISRLTRFAVTGL